MPIGAGARGIRLAGAALLGATLAVAAPSADAFPAVLYGFDMDQISTPRFTQEGFVSVTFLDVFVEDPNATEAYAGYLPGRAPITDFRVLPVSSADPDLWADGHRAPPGGATLRIAGLAPGAYTLLLMSHNPAVTAADRTFFEVDGVPVGWIANVPNPPGEVAEVQTLAVPIVVGPEGRLDVTFRGDPETGRDGWLNGIAIVPEPATVALLLPALAAALAFRRRRAPGRRSGAEGGARGLRAPERRPGLGRRRPRLAPRAER